jgi:hypothetical protein
MDWVCLSQDRVQWRVLVNECSSSLKSWEFLDQSETVSGSIHAWNS